MTPTRIAQQLLAAYKLVLSPLLPPACRFFPSCADYTSEAIGRYGLARGLVQGLRRLLRCHPWQPGGVDPVS
jgi:hypothetical protein